ncbi:MAG: hypothetical protein ACFFBP_07405 [Promethearchaeota archaeon]
MNAKDKNTSMAINIKQYPMNLLIPSIDNVITFQAIHYLNKENQFQFIFQGENLDIQISEDLKNFIKFAPSETKEFSIKVLPTADGKGKLIINASIIKEVQRKVKVKKVRASVPRSRINEIFNKYRIEFTETIDPFNFQDYFFEMSMDEISNAQNQIDINRNNGINVDDDLKNLAKAYLSNKNLQKALEICLNLSDDNEKYKFYYSFLRAYSSIDVDTIMQILKNLNDINMKHFLIKNISLELVKQDPEKASQIVLLIDDSAYKIKLLTQIIGHTIQINPEIAFNLSHLINDELTLAGLLINIAKHYHEINNKSDLIKTIRQILNIFIHSPKINLSENKYRNRSYEFLLYVMQGIAEVEGPAIVNSIIEDLPDIKLKEQIHKNIDDTIFEIVEETQIFHEPTLVFSQYFIFNILSSTITEELKYFSSIGGNMSNNLILREFNFRSLIISLFSFNFSIYPMLERLYNELNQSIAYYIFPSINNHDETEVNVINKTINNFLGLNRISNQINVYNLDFIPYLGIPTVIISSESNILQDKINKSLGKSVNCINDNSFFQGGRSLENLRGNLSSNNFKITNLILSYEFINDFNVFKKLIQAII